MKKTPPETDRFVDAMRKIVSVPKKEVDRRLAEEKKRRDAAKDQKRKA